MSPPGSPPQEQKVRLDRPPHRVVGACAHVDGRKLQAPGRIHPENVLSSTAPVMHPEGCSRGGHRFLGRSSSPSRAPREHDIHASRPRQRRRRRVSRGGGGRRGRTRTAAQARRVCDALKQCSGPPHGSQAAGPRPSVSGPPDPREALRRRFRSRRNGAGSVPIVFVDMSSAGASGTARPRARRTRMRSQS